MIVDWTISLGNIFTIAFMLFVAVGFYWRQIYDSKEFKEDISDIKIDLKGLNRVITELALQNQRLDNFTERLNRMDIRLDEFSHGKGFIR